MNPESPKEFRLKSGQKILDYISHFSVTEKTIFGILVLVAGFSALTMAQMVNNYFMTEIPAKGGELREGAVGLPHMVNPVLAITDVDRDLSTLIYSGLMKYNNNDLVSDLAESYTVSPDRLTYTFKLRPKIYFHDGTPITSADVAFTIQKISDVALKSPRRADWNNVTVVTTSPDEIKFTLKQPYSPFLTNTTIGILPKHIWNNLNDDQFGLSEYNIEPVGSGPFKLDSLSRDAGGIPKEYHLVTAKQYYGKTPYLNAITFVFFSDNEKAFSALENGSIDSLASITSLQAKTIASNYEDKYSILSEPLPRIFGVFFNQSSNPALTDKSVRQALNISIDRSEIIKKVLGGYGIPIQGPLPFGMNNTRKSNTDILTNKINPDEANIALATSILTKNGWYKNPITGIYEKKGPKNAITILSFDIYTADTSDLKQAAELVKNSWNTLGAKVDVKIFDSSDLYQNIIRPRKYDALLFGQLIGKDRDFYAFWHSSQRNAPGLNVAMYVNNKADTLLETIRSTNDDSIRKNKYTELDQMIRTDIPAIFLYSPDFIYAFPKSLRNNNPPETNITIPSDRWNSINDWYLMTEKVWKIFANK